MAMYLSLYKYCISYIVFLVSIDVQQIYGFTINSTGCNYTNWNLSFLLVFGECSEQIVYNITHIKHNTKANFLCVECIYCVNRTWF